MRKITTRGWCLPCCWNLFIFFADSTLILVASPIFPDILVSTHLRTTSHQSDTRHKHDLCDKKSHLISKLKDQDWFLKTVIQKLPVMHNKRYPKIAPICDKFWQEIECANRWKGLHSFVSFSSWDGTWPVWNYGRATRPFISCHPQSAFDVCGCACCVCSCVPKAGPGSSKSLCIKAAWCKSAGFCHYCSEWERAHAWWLLFTDIQWTYSSTRCVMMCFFFFMF